MSRYDKIIVCVVTFVTIMFAACDIYGCENLQETQAVVTLYDGNVLTTAELRLEDGQVLIHTYLSSGRDSWIHLDPENIKSVATPEGWLIIEPTLDEFSIVPFGGDDMIEMGIL